MEEFTSIQQIFNLAYDYFLAERAENLSVSLQCNFSGPGGGEWSVIIKDAKLAIEEARLAGPDLRVDLSAADGLMIANGVLNPIHAYMKGNIHIIGDTAKGLEMQKAFRLPEKFAWLRSLL